MAEKEARRPCSCGITAEGMTSTHRSGKRIAHVAYPAECWEMAEGHDFQPVAGHPDDNECTHRADGTDATYCGLPAENHVTNLERVLGDLYPLSSTSEAKADAWDEGHGACEWAGLADDGTCPRHRNPYRIPSAEQNVDDHA